MHLTPFHLPTRTMERLSVGTGSLSEQQMAEPTGVFKTVGPASFFMVFLLLTQILEQPWVKMAPFSGQQTGELRGLSRRAGQATFFMVSPFPMQITESLLV